MDAHAAHAALSLFGKELFIRFTASAFRKLLSVYVFSYFPFGFEGRMWDLIVSIPVHCLSFYFAGRTCHLVGFVTMRLITGIGVLMCVLVC